MRRVYQYMSQVVCWEEQLRGIVCDRTAILFSERASNSTFLLFFWWILQVFFCTARFWVYPDRIELLPDLDWHHVHFCEKTRTASPFWDFFLPELVHLEWWCACRGRSRCGRCNRRSRSITVHRLAMQDINENTSWMSLHCAEIQGMFGRMRKSCRTEKFSSVLLLLSGSWSKLQLTSSKFPQTLT